MRNLRLPAAVRTVRRRMSDPRRRSAREVEEAQCPRCGDWFEARPGKVYCSPACRLSAMRRRRRQAKHAAAASGATSQIPRSMKRRGVSLFAPRSLR